MKTRPTKKDKVNWDANRRESVAADSQQLEQQQNQYKKQREDINKSLERIHEKIVRSVKDQFDQMRKFLTKQNQEDQQRQRLQLQEHHQQLLQVQQQLQLQQQQQLEKQTTAVVATGSEQQPNQTDRSANSDNNVAKSTNALLDSLGASLASDHQKFMAALTSAHLPIYFGVKDQAISWLFTFKHMADCHFLSEPIRLVAIRLVFFEEALFWYTKNWHSSYPTSWDEFEKKFIEAFIPNGLAAGLKQYINFKSQLLKNTELASCSVFLSEAMKVSSHAVGGSPEMNCNANHEAKE